MGEGIREREFGREKLEITMEEDWDPRTEDLRKTDVALCQYYWG